MEGDEDICSVAVDYFKKLFSSSSPSETMIDLATKEISPKISEDQKAKLDQPFTKAEVERARYESVQSARS